MWIGLSDDTIKTMAEKSRMRNLAKMNKEEIIRKWCRETFHLKVSDEEVFELLKRMKKENGKK